MKISVLIPVYRVEDYIGQCAESLFSQTYQDLEFIFVDDCSPDNSIGALQNVLEKYPSRQQQVRIIRNESNLGSGATRSIALAAATGQFVTYVDSDDILPTDAIEKLAKAQQESGANIVDGAYQQLFPDGTLGQTQAPFNGNTTTMLRLMLAQNTISHQLWGRLINRNLHTDNNIDFIPGINMAEDYCMMARLLFTQTSKGIGNPRHCIDDVVYYYRKNPSSTFCTNESKNIVSFTKANCVVGDFLRENDKKGKFTYAYELGMLNTIHHALSSNLPLNTFQLSYKPTKTIFRICNSLLCHKATRHLLRIAYLTLKRIYITFTLLTP